MYAYKVNRLMSEIRNMVWKPRIQGNGPIYLELAEAIGRAIVTGELTAGQRLPTQRELAQALGVDLTTVTRGYAQAQRLGHIHSEGRRGSFVRRLDAPRKTALDVYESDTYGIPAPVIDSSEVNAIENSGRNMPPEPAGDLLREAIRDGTDRILARTGQLPVHYQPPGGPAYNRSIIASVFNRSMPCVSDQVVITAGAQNAIHAICNALLKPGDVVACGKYTYPGLLAVARRIGARIVPVDMDDDGLVPESLEEVARRHRPKLLYLVPYNDNPTTASLTTARRNAIAECAERHDFQILEDDAYGGLVAYRPQRVVSTIIPSRCWYMVTLSKSFTPAFRVANVRAPSVRDAFGMIAGIQETTTMASPFDAAIDMQWLQDGTLMKLGAAVAREAMERQKIARDILGKHVYKAQPEGYHLWLPRPGSDAPSPIQSPLLSGLPVVPASVFAVVPNNREQSLRVSLGGPRSREKLASDLNRLNAWLTQNGQ